MKNKEKPCKNKNIIFEDKVERVKELEKCIVSIQQQLQLDWLTEADRKMYRNMLNEYKQLHYSTLNN